MQFVMMSVICFMCFTLFCISHVSAQISNDALNQKLRLLYDVLKPNLTLYDGAEFQTEGVFSQTSFRMEYRATDYNIRGIPDMSIKTLQTSFDDLTMNVTFNIPLLTIYADNYEIKCTAFYFFKNQCSQKYVEIKVRNYDIMVNMKLDETASGTHITAFTVIHHNDDVQVDLPGCSWGLNAIMKVKGAAFLEEARKNLNYLAYDFVMDANIYLEDKAPEDLLKIIDSIISEDDMPFSIVLGAFLEVWKSGTNELLPPLSPIPIPDIEDVVYDESTISVTFSASGITVTGLDTFTTNSIEVSETDAVNIQVNVAGVHVHVDAYKLKGRAFFVYPIDCKGVLEVILQNVDAAIDFRLAHNNTNVWVDYANLRLQLNQDAQVKMASCPSLVTNAINTEVNNMLHSEQMISELMHDQLIPAVDELLTNTTIQDLTMFIKDIVFDSIQ